MDLPGELDRVDYIALPGSSANASFPRSAASPTCPPQPVAVPEEIQQKQGTEREAGSNRDEGLYWKGEDAEMGNRYTANEDLSHRTSASPLPKRQVVIYGTGHVLNDLTAACWFTYLLNFLTDVGLSPKQAGAVMLSGQVADGFATVIVGQLIDKFGRFKLWHGGGSLLVAISFSSVFGGCVVCELFGTNSKFVTTVSYSAFAAIFNLGWAATQVSHMSLVNCITANPTSRVALNSCRNAFTMVANLCLYAIAYGVFWSLPSTASGGVHAQFRWIAWVAILLGTCFVVVFLSGLREPKLLHHIPGSMGLFTRITIMSWFKRPLYYQVALVYMLTRITTNVSQAFLPFYLVQDLQLAESSKALMPALIYVCSFLSSVVLQEMRWTDHRLKGVFVGAAFLWIVAGVVMYLLPVALKSSMYAVAGILGLGNALMLVTATSMQGVLVGHDLSSCAFVYGSVSFLDKVASGLVLYVIERLNDGSQSCSNSSGVVTSCNDSIVRVAVGLVPAGCALLAVMISSSMNLRGRTESEASVLGNKVESLNHDQSKSGADPPRVSRSGPKNARVTSRPVLLPPRAGSSSTHRSGRDNSDEDYYKHDAEAGSSGSRENEPPFTIWKKLESAMVGRWGSIRKQPQIWLE